MDKGERVSLWTVLEDATSAQQAMVKARVEDAKGLLTQTYKTFPTYTSHDAGHAENVLARIEDLLGPNGLAKCSALQAALLILAAYFHDVGMVVTEHEAASFMDDPAFAEYLSTHPVDHLQLVEEDGVASVDLRENFLRWRHAARAHHRLASFSDEAFSWGAVSLRPQLGNLCASHNDSTASLSEFQTSFLATADLLFCGVLLRLGDLLDFDSSRTPARLYQHLGLDVPTTDRTRVSQIEWLKHMHSDGFVFPANGDERTDGYSIGLVAGPRQPATERAIRQFLDYVDGEVAECRRVLRGASRQWRDHPLPGLVSRENIHSHGYVYGQFEFVLERRAVLELFMGRNLYGDPGVFVRELLQNAIDATMARARREQRPAPDDVNAVEITTWVDAEGRQWLSMSDSGIGMTREQVTDYFLSVGRSYYSSAEFKLEASANQSNSTFVPISRFGIGLLSCFMACDRLEVSTLAATDSRRARPKAVRLQMTGVEDFFVLQTGDMNAEPMPTEAGSGAGYRRSPGTTIAVRVKEDVYPTDFLHAPHAQSALFDCPVPVTFGEVLVGGPATAEFSEVPATGSLFRRELGPDEYIGPAFDASDAESPITRETLVVSLSNYSPDPDIRGLCVLTRYVLSDAAATRLVTNLLDDAGITDADTRARLLPMLAVKPRWGRTAHADPFAPSAEHQWGVAVETPREAEQLLAALNAIGNGDVLSDVFQLLDLRGLGWLSDDSKWNEDVPQTLTSEGHAMHEALTLLEKQTSSFIPGLRKSNASSSVAIVGTHQDLLTTAGRKPAVLGSPRVAHNGVVVSEANLFGLNGVARGSGQSEWLAAGWVSLTNEARPEVTVARDRTISIPWRVRSSVELARRRAIRVACEHHGISTIDQPGYATGQSAPSESTMTIEEILSPAEATNADGWPAEPLFLHDGTSASLAVLLGKELPLVVEFPRVGVDPAGLIAVALLERHFQFDIEVDAFSLSVMHQATLRDHKTVPDQLLRWFPAQTFLDAPDLDDSEVSLAAVRAWAERSAASIAARRPDSVPAFGKALHDILAQRNGRSETLSGFENALTTLSRRFRLDSPDVSILCLARPGGSA